MGWCGVRLQLPSPHGVAKDPSAHLSSSCASLVNAVMPFRSGLPCIKPYLHWPTIPVIALDTSPTTASCSSDSHLSSETCDGPHSRVQCCRRPPHPELA
eukprot:12846323-Alexandrium_andersonii.AAC.1